MGRRDDGLSVHRMMMVVVGACGAGEAQGGASQAPPRTAASSLPLWGCGGGGGGGVFAYRRGARQKLAGGGNETSEQPRGLGAQGGLWKHKARRRCRGGHSSPRAHRGQEDRGDAQPAQWPNAHKTVVGWREGTMDGCTGRREDMRLHESSRPSFPHANIFQPTLLIPVQPNISTQHQYSSLCLCSLLLSAWVVTLSFLYPSTHTGVFFFPLWCSLPAGPDGLLETHRKSQLICGSTAPPHPHHVLHTNLGYLPFMGQSPTPPSHFSVRFGLGARSFWRRHVEHDCGEAMLWDEGLEPTWREDLQRYHTRGAWNETRDRAVHFQHKLFPERNPTQQS